MFGINIYAEVITLGVGSKQKANESVTFGSFPDAVCIAFLYANFING